MAVSVIEVSSPAVNTGPTISTTPLAGDVVVVVGQQLRGTPRQFASVSGMGATWAFGYRSTDARHEFWIGTGATTSGLLTIGWSGSNSNYFFTAYLIRGLTTTTIAGVAAAVTGTSLTGTAQTATNGQIVLASGIGFSDASTYPSAQSPSGWTAQTVRSVAATGAVGTAHRIPTSSASHSTSISAPASVSLGVSSIVLGSEVVGGGGVTVTAPALAATTDVLNPTVTAVTGVTVTAPSLATTTDLLDPTVSAVGPVTIAAPILATSTDVLDPTVSLAPEGVTVQHFAVTGTPSDNPFTVNLPVTPQAGDVVVVGVGTTSTSLVRSVTTVSGVGASWSEVLESTGANAPTSTWWVGTGASASGDITVSLSSGRVTSTYVWLIRGLPSAAAIGAAVRSVGAVTALTGPSHVAGLGSIVLGMGAAQNTTLTWPSAQSPSGAWTTSAVHTPGDGGSRGAGYAIPTASVAHQTSGTLSTAAGLVISQVVLGAGGVATVAAPTLAATTDLLDPTVTTAAPAVTVAAPTLATTTDVRNPSVSAVGMGQLIEGASGDFGISGGNLASVETFQYLSGASGEFGLSGKAIVSRETVVDPLTNRPQYQLIVVQPDGTRLGELNKAQALSPLEHDFAGESWDFAMPAHDPKLALCLAAVNEIQVWRGGQLLRWGPIIKRSGDDVQVRVSCASVRWYLDQKAQIGKLPKTDLLLNGDFEDGEAHWSFGFDADSIPALPPLHSIVPEGPDGSNALKISGADESQLITASLETLTIFVPNEATYLSGGEQQILDFAATLPPAPVGVIEGHTADADAGTGMALSLARANAVRSTILAVRPAASFTTVGKGETEPVATNSTEAGQAKNRRVVIKYEGLLPADGHRQYAYQRVNYMVPEAAKWPMRVVFIGSIKILDYVASSKDGWSVYIHRVLASDRSTVLDYGTAPLDAETPRGVWLEQECSIEVPADGVTYELEVRYYPPSGDALWDRGGLFPAERLGFVDVRQEHIIEHLVEHAQDPAMGNATLYIQNRPGFSGITRQRKYDFHEARSVGDAINDFQAIDKGLDVDVEVTPTGKYLASYYPRKGQDTGVTLALGGKVIRFDVQEDATQVGNVAVVNADGSGPGREQSYAMDPDALGGLRLRRTFSAEQETPAWELAQAADRQLARFRTPPLLWSITCDPKWTSWLLDRVKLGDTVHCVIDAGWAQIDGPVRIVGESLDPATDALTYDIDVEV